MRKLAPFLLIAVLVLLAAPAAFAQGTPEHGGGTNWVAISASFGMALASGVCGYAQSRASAAASESYARNPGAGDRIFISLLISLALIESMALYSFAIIWVRAK
jgi:F-type H+-transporting ATPase subunit c